MRITFFADDPRYSQLACNGGTRTIIKCSEVLRELDHKAAIVAHKDRYSWEPHVPPVHHVPKDTEALIAVTIFDVKHIMKYKKNHPKVRLAYYSRPIELWNCSKEKAIKILTKFQNKYHGKILANSGWQIAWLSKYDLNGTLVFSGQDIEYADVEPDYDLKSGYRMTIGYQYSSKPRKGWKEFKKIVSILGTEKYEYVAFGSEKCNEKFLSTYLRNPDRIKLNNLYMHMDVFVCCSSLEGYFNVATEAAIQGCLLLCNNNPKNGVMDIANENTAHIYSSLEEIPHIMQNLDFTKVEKCQYKIRNEIGNRSENMKKLIKILGG